MKNKEKKQFKNKSFFKYLFLFFIFYFLIFNFESVQAQINDLNYENLMINLVAPTPLIRADLLKIIFTAIRYLLSFLGVVALLILIYGGFLWMTARGDEEKVRKAKKVLINGLVGLIIILLSYAIVMFVVGPLLRAYLGEGPGEGVGGGGAGGFPRGADYLVITSRYPKPGETTPQNIKIVITFNQNLKPESVKFARPDLNNPKNTICDDWNFAVQDTDGNFIDGSFVIRGNSLIFIPKGDCPYPLDAFKCEKDQEGNCFLTFKKPGCCSCFAPGNDYKIKLIAYRNRQYVGILGTREGKNKLYKDEIWSFNVANYLDTRSPQVETNLPSGQNVARNVGILVEFSKDIDLSTLTIYNPNCVPGSANCNQDNCNSDSCLNYAVDDIDKASVKIYAGDTPLAGFFERFSTKAFLFRPSQRCGPAGSNLYYCRCFPPLTEIRVELVNQGDLAIRDVNCNTLDCQNGKCSWNFRTSDQVDIDPPEVRGTDPEDKEEDVDRLVQIKVNFSEDMDSTSINEDTFVLRPEIPPRSIETINNISTFIPSQILEPETNYSPIIYGSWQKITGCQLDPAFNFGVKDLAGNAMFGNYIWSFKTGGLVNAGNPYIDWVSPSEGPKGECVTIHGYNLGCCSPYQCQDDQEAQKKMLKTKKCGLAPNIGKVEFCSLSNEEGDCLDYTSSEILTWREINKPEKCIVGKDCPKDCSSQTCNPINCSECKFCSGSDEECRIEKCWCRIKPYSPENEIIVIVPEKAINRSPSKPGEIKVVPAQ